MPIITKLEYQVKDKNRVNIFVDDEFFVGIYADLIYKYNLKKGDDIRKTNLKEIMETEMYMKAKEKALNFISRSAKSEHEIVKKLSSDFDEQTVDKVIAFLKKYNYINDSQLAHSITSGSVNVKKIGKNRIQHKLKQKGIYSEDVENALEEIDPDTEYENAMYHAQKKFNQLARKFDLFDDEEEEEYVKYDDYETRQEKYKIKQKIYQSLFSHLQYRGFDFELIKNIISEIFAENNL
ncbi:MAG: recombination regulator RecX [Clostridioides sp.]|jgi:regulatory protein|nr:recombination regulator RecX [Clostridioides sp.]